MDQSVEALIMFDVVFAGIEMICPQCSSRNPFPSYVDYLFQDLSAYSGLEP
jgi:hypothetical protein